MRNTRLHRRALWAAVLPMLGQLLADRVTAQTLEEALRAFWASPHGVPSSVSALPARGASFVDVYAGLRSTGLFDPDVPTGRRELVRENTDGTQHRYVIIVPTSYDPQHPHPVRVYLHGGVRRPAWDSGGGWWRYYDELTHDDEIAVFPAAWDESIWWQASQVENLAGILRDLKGTYNIDDNRVYLFGVSDGGTGVYFHALRAATPWAAFIPMIAHPAVLSNPRVGTDGELYPVNLWNRPFYVVNGERDRLYPARMMRPWIQFFQSRGVDVTFRAVDAGHSVDWWPDEAEAIDRFIRAKVRDPHPQRLIWETERTERYNRLHWLVIDQLGPPGSLPPEVPHDPFPHSRPSGRVEAERHGNNVVVEARGVAELTLLFSPDVFDFAEPVAVTVNAREVWRGTLTANVDVLLEWAARDRDRSMLYGAVVTVEVPPFP